MTRVDEASWLQFRPAQGETLRAALERTLRDAIVEGSLRAGTQLPSSRELAQALGVSRGVTSDTYAQLEAQGYLLIAPRQAPSVAAVPSLDTGRADEPVTPAPRITHDFAPTTPDVSLFPRRDWSAAEAHAIKTVSDAELDYGDTRGNARLREALASHLGRTRGVVADPARIVIVQGTAQGIDLMLLLLASRGAREVSVENPSLTSQHQRVFAHGLRLYGVPVDDEGVDVRRVRGDAVIVTPAHQFPTGVVLSGARRRALLNWAAAHDGWVIEDDYDGEFRYDREPVRALQGLDPARVVHIGTLSKSLAPALRLGWMVLPEPLAQEAAAMKRLLDGGSPVLPQLAFLRMLETGAYDRHVRRVRAEYRRRRDALSAALTQELPGFHFEGVAAGVHARLDLPGLDDADVARRCRESGLAVETLGQYAIGDVPPGLVLGYGRLHVSAIPRAVRALAAVVLQRG